MARKPMVTRSFELTVSVIMFVETTTQKVYFKEVETPRTYTDNDKLLKAIKSTEETDTQKVVCVQSSRVITKLYGMSESDFLKYSIELDPETRKALETEDDTEVDTEE